MSGPDYLPWAWTGGRAGGVKCLKPVCLLPALQLLLWHSVLWAGQEAAPLVSVTTLPPPLPLPRSFLLKSLEQVRKIQAGNSVLLEQLVSGVCGEACRGGGSRLGGHSGSVCLVCTRAWIPHPEY